MLDRLRLGKARHAIRMAFLLEISGIPTPRVAAAGRRLVGGVVERSYVVTERVPGGSHVDRALCALEGEARQGLLRATGELVGRLHREGLAHRDLKAGNLLVADDGSLVLVDLDGVRSRRSVTLSRASRDLARLFRDLRARAAVTRDDEGTLLGAWSEVTGHDAMSAHERIEREPRLRAASDQGT